MKPSDNLGNNSVDVSPAWANISLRDPVSTHHIVGHDPSMTHQTESAQCPARYMTEHISLPNYDSDDHKPQTPGQ